MKTGSGLDHILKTGSGSDLIQKPDPTRAPGSVTLNINEGLRIRIRILKSLGLGFLLEGSDLDPVMN